MNPHNCNSIDLVNAIKSCTELGGMTCVTWVMARENPELFVTFVQENFIEIQKEFENKITGKKVYPRFLPVKNNQPISNKISWIKIVRTIAQIGLADAKNYVETLPNNGDFRYFCFNNIQSANESTFAKECTRHGIQVEWMFCDDTDNIPLYDNLPNYMKLQ